MSARASEGFRAEQNNITCCCNACFVRNDDKGNVSVRIGGVYHQTFNEDGSEDRCGPCYAFNYSKSPDGSFDKFLSPCWCYWAKTDERAQSKCCVPLLLTGGSSLDECCSPLGCAWKSDYGEDRGVNPLCCYWENNSTTNCISYGCWYKNNKEGREQHFISPIAAGKMERDQLTRACACFGVTGSWGDCCWIGPVGYSDKCNSCMVLPVMGCSQDIECCGIHRKGYITPVCGHVRNSDTGTLNPTLPGVFMCGDTFCSVCGFGGSVEDTVNPLECCRNRADYSDCLWCCFMGCLGNCLADSVKCPKECCWAGFGHTKDKCIMPCGYKTHDTREFCSPCGWFSVDGNCCGDNSCCGKHGCCLICPTSLTIDRSSQTFFHDEEIDTDFARYNRAHPDNPIATKSTLTSKGVIDISWTFDPYFRDGMEPNAAREVVAAWIASLTPPGEQQINGYQTAGSYSPPPGSTTME